MVNSKSFEREVEGKTVSLITLENKRGTRVSITNFGGRIVEWLFNGTDVVMGYETLEDYFNSTEYYYGATIGRFANRIADGKFSLAGENYQLEINNPPNHLHGGKNGYHNKVWSIEESSGNRLMLSYLSEHGDQGYPGNLSVVLSFTLSEDDEVIIEYSAETDATTILNLTNHSFFNLNGQGSGTILNHSLQINADHFTPINENLIPVGLISKVDYTPFDFRIAKPIGENIGAEDEQLTFGGGYDHNYVLTKNPEIFSARAVGDQTGIALEVYTTEPGMQFYSGNFMTGKNRIKYGKTDDYRTSFCLETQHFPDSPNQPGFPSTVLNPREVFSSRTVYKLLQE